MGDERAFNNRGGRRIQGIGRSRGGATTKLHLVVDALGLPLAFEVTEGESSRSTLFREAARECPL